MNNKYIVITSINAPSEAIRRFSAWKDWKLIVVGDRKSPIGWNHENVIYLGLEEQYEQFGEFAKALPENTYKRKMIGYLCAIKLGATVIFESDDDNIPYGDALSRVEGDLHEDEDLSEVVASDSGWLNIYSRFGAPQCWPRGLPINHIQNRNYMGKSMGSEGLKWGVLQYLADQDPDVDALFRLTHDDQETYFARDQRMRLAKGTYAPFNSQATLWSKECFPLLFLPVGVSDRVTDILRGYIALACLWQGGRTLAYQSPIVYQERNEHDLYSDLSMEMPIYKNADIWASIIQESVQDKTTFVEAYRAALEKLVQDSYLPVENLSNYDCFVQLMHRGGECHE